MTESEDEIESRFPRSRRILSRGNFRRVYDEGAKYQARFFTAFVSPSSAPETRIGVTVTRKIGNSVTRNRCRRLVREVFRKNKWRIAASVDIVINVKGALTEADFSELEADFLKFLEKCKWEGSS